MTDKQKKKCHAIIHAASAAAGSVGGGLAQFPGTDNSVIVPIQVSMVISLAAVFGIGLTETAAKATIATTTATLVGRGISQFLVGWIPVFGNAVNASTAAAVTEAIGWAVVRDFDDGVLTEETTQKIKVGFDALSQIDRALKAFKNRKVLLSPLPIHLNKEKKEKQKEKE